MPVSVSYRLHGPRPVRACTVVHSQSKIKKRSADQLVSVKVQFWALSVCTVHIGAKALARLQFSALSSPVLILW